MSAYGHSNPFLKESRGPVSLSGTRETLNPFLHVPEPAKDESQGPRHEASILKLMPLSNYAA